MTTLEPAVTHHSVASDPNAHVWVAASAGTGKTRSLTDRILRLLLAGAPPESLFAITFTRTAAAEMQARVFGALAAFAAADDNALDKALTALGEAPSPALRARARALLFKVIDSPRGLEIRTIHAAAQALLSAFPLEAGLPPRVDPLEERSAERLRRRALAQALAEPTLAADVERLAVEAGEGAIGGRLAELVKAGAGYAHIGGPGRVEPFLRDLVGLPQGLTAQQILEAAVTPPAFDDLWVRGFIAGMEVLGTEAKQREADSARDWLALSATQRVEQVGALLSMVRTKAGDPRKRDAELKKVPELAGPIERLLEATAALIETRRALAFVDHAGAWIRLGMAVAGHYQALKRAAAAVDFDDMVGLAAGLIEQGGMANAVAERLDRQIRHILVDEAQDTNEAQWRLIEGLASEFDVGAGQHGETLRTRFVVGDFKQAIFRFQGTDPKVFLSVRERWREVTLAAGRPMEDVPLNRNFRSSPLILSLVDEVMQALGPEAIGLPAAEPLPPHEADRSALPGRVMLFPPHVAEADSITETGEEAELADPDHAARIARLIAALVREGSPDRLVVTDRDGGHRLAGPGDVLVLLRRRGDLMAALVRALHAENIPVAGVDRARLAEPLAVRDLLSLIRFVLLPADDLALAEVLTSPLCGLPHESVRKVRRPGESLWAAFATAADPAHADAQGLLRRALARADFATPHAFLEAVLAEGGRARFRARLGPEADDGIDALLAEALAFEADHPPTLQGFLAHIGASDDPVGREPDATPGLVRLLTVHRAKGLEAPIVVLADALAEGVPRRDSVSWTAPEGRAGVPLVWGQRERLPAAVATLAQAAEAADAAERSRLLYVALTRAEQVLVVAGQVSPKQAEARRQAPDDFDSWHDRIRRAMEQLGAQQQEEGPFGPHLLLDSGNWPAAGTVAPPSPAPAVPAWAKTPPPAEPVPPRLFTPSAPLPDEAPQPPPGPLQRAAAERGTRLHRLFEHLPGLPPDARRAAGRRLLESLGAPDPDPLIDEVLAVLDDPAFAPLFGPLSLAEAPIAGHVDGLTVAGTVDRLVVEPGRVRVLDLKTGFRVPGRAEEAHPSQLRQMAAYRAVLRSAFPGRRVEALLLFTAGPRLLPLPDALLDAHWPPPGA